MFCTWHYTTPGKWNRFFAYFTSESASRPIESGTCPVPGVKNWGYSRRGSGILEARAPKPAGYKIMDDQQTKGEKFKEKLIDRYAPVQSVQDEVSGVKEVVGAENLGTDPATAQAICIIFACYSRIMRHFKTDTLGTDPKFLPKGGSAARNV